ncbi:hypothetical protein ACFXDE_28765 [Kitasatospora sp. NPDC059408]|uniref:hypothetical protein n=1 Tax=Kitasatospora sp. NPDC059408 TaxID=3346823 RepID=UPI0036B07AF9
MPASRPQLRQPGGDLVVTAGGRTVVRIANQSIAYRRARLLRRLHLRGSLR